MNTSYSQTQTQDAYKSPERLEEEVNETRARIGEKLETLSNRLSPGELLDQVLGMAREHGGEFTRNLGSQVKSNPVPLLITGIGMSWLMMASSNPGYQRYGYNTRNNYPRGYTDYPYDANAGVRRTDFEHSPDRDPNGPDMMDKAKDAMGRVGEHVEDLKDSARGKFDRAANVIHDNMENVHQRMHSGRNHMHSAGQNMHSAQECVTGFFREQPVLAASLGVALGAAIGALLPATEIEDKLMGDVSDQAVNKAQNIASEQYEKVRETAKDVAANVKQQSRGQSDEQPSGDNRNSDGASSQAI